jgi:hypothetical protein
MKKLLFVLFFLVFLVSIWLNIYFFNKETAEKIKVDNGKFTSSTGTISTPDVDIYHLDTKSST